MATTKKHGKVVFLAISGESDQHFRNYVDACRWLDEVSPETAGRGFTTADVREDERLCVEVRHAAR